MLTTKKTLSLTVLIGTLIAGTVVATSNAPIGPTIPPCTARQTRIIFVNGVNNKSEFDAWASSVGITNALQEGGVNNFAPGYIYSGFESLTSDFLQAAVYTNLGKSTLDFIDSVNMTNMQIGMGPTAGPIGAADIPSLAQSSAAKLQAHIDAVAADMRNSISQTQHTIYVCHSRGTLVCNFAYRKLQQDKVAGLNNLGVFDIAMVDSKGPDGASHFDYITFRSDAVVAAVPGAAPANFGTYSLGDSGAKSGLAHGVNDTYLQDSYTSVLHGDIINDPLKTEIVRRIKTMKSLVEKETFPCKAA